MFRERESFAGALEPGDVTHYEMVVVEMFDAYEVVVLNDGFFDKITFLKGDPKTPLTTHRGRWQGKTTNPWTIRAAISMVEKFLERQAEKG